MFEERTQPTGAYISYTTYFLYIFYLIKYSLRDPHFIRPQFFYVRDSLRDYLLRLTFATPFVTTTRDSRLRLHLRLPFATHVRATTLPKDGLC